MADLKARRVLGGKYTADDTLELLFTYEGAAHSCVQYIEVVSGPTVTHGGGAAADSRLHYKASGRDADGDGIIDYSSLEMLITQSEKGTTVVKVVSEIILKSVYDAYMVEYTAWLDAYVTLAESEEEEAVLAEGAPDAPTYPEPTVYKSGELTLEWENSSFV